MSGLVVAQDLSTAACGILNAGYFARYWWRTNGQRARRLGAAALALVSVAAVAEAIFSQALFRAQQGLWPLELLTPAAWALIRLPLFAATVFISILILRRLRS
jgi:hypothetical protein